MLENREAAKMLEEIVGSQNFSEDPAIISSYTLQAFGVLIGVAGKDGYDRVKLGAVILPETTDEVQAISKVCNKYKISFKAHSTGLGAHGLATKPGSVQIDLRRMNRIIKLDDKNMFAVVEPYVSALELATEARKNGLYCHIIGAGSHTSILASTTSHLGYGHSALITSHNARNCLGAEWVLPTGEVFTWGLVDDGKVGHPGPGLYGLCRGQVGTFGSLGVFTKAAVKLYPWPGPTEMKVTGKSPTHGFEIPDNIKIYYLAFPNTERLGDAIYELTESQIAYMVWALPLFFFPQRCMGNSNDDHYEVWKKIEAAGAIHKNLDQLTVMIAARSKEELAYKMQVMKDIINETGAQEFLADFMTKEVEEKMFCHLIQVHKPCTEFRLSGGDMGTTFLQIMHFDNHMKAKTAIREMQKPYVDEGVLIDVAQESGWGGPMEQRPVGHMEYVNFTNPLKRELVKRQIDFIRETYQYAIDEKLLGTGTVAGGRGETDKVLSKYLGNYLQYKEKIRKALDPNDISDALLYLGEEE